MAIDREALRAWVAASCAAQGIEVLVSDPGVLARVGVLLGRRDAAGQPPPGGDRGARRSQSPGGRDSTRVQSAAPRNAGADGGEVEHRADNGRLPGEVQRLPGLP